MPPEDPGAALARQWLAKAGRDVRMAELAIEPALLLPDIAATHCQQAAEKALKGYLAWENQPYSSRPTRRSTSSAT
jgi:HEPN domain-containing protein